jgi:hypothetical protein
LYTYLGILELLLDLVDRISVFGLGKADVYQFGPDFTRPDHRPADTHEGPDPLCAQVTDALEEWKMMEHDV